MYTLEDRGREVGTDQHVPKKNGEMPPFVGLRCSFFVDNRLVFGFGIWFAPAVFFLCSTAEKTILIGSEKELSRHLMCACRQLWLHERLPSRGP